MSLKEKEFIEIEYTGKTKEEEIIFDTTDEKIAKDNGLFNEQVKYGPVTVCLGEGHIIPGLDKQIIGKEPGKYEFEVGPEDAFGKKNPKYIQLIPTSKFAKQGIKPMPGLQVNIDGSMGIVKTVSGGRTIVDFNNPLSGKDVVYSVKINKKVSGTKEQIEALLQLVFQVKAPAVKEEDGKFTIEMEQELPEEAQKAIKEKILSLTKTKNVAFSFKNSKKQQ